MFAASQKVAGEIANLRDVWKFCEDRRWKADKTGEKQALVKKPWDDKEYTKAKRDIYKSYLKTKG